jgi:hypothetical protein
VYKPAIFKDIIVDEERKTLSSDRFKLLSSMILIRKVLYQCQNDMNTYIKLLILLRDNDILTFTLSKDSRIIVNFNWGI